MEVKNIKEPIIRVLSNMLFTCLQGPTRKPVLPIDIKLPTVYGMANLLGRITISGTYIVDIIDAAVPSTKNSKNPMIRCLYVISGRNGQGFSVLAPVTLEILLEISEAQNGIFDQDEFSILLALPP